MLVINTPLLIATDNFQVSCSGGATLCPEVDTGEKAHPDYDRKQSMNNQKCQQVSLVWLVKLFK